MADVQPRSKSLIIFYILVAYIMVQFGWWAYMMIDLNTLVYEQQAEIALLQDPSAATAEVNQQLRSKVWMIAGEGIVFILILVLGILRIQRAFRKEVNLANQQRNFLLSVTHELKSPIASAKLYLQTLLKRKDITEEKREEIIRKTIKDTERLTSLVENILTATKIDNSSYPLHLEETNVSELVQSVVNDAVETVGQNHPTSLEVADNVKLKVDTLAFTSMLLNLYENAVKYSPEGGEIKVSLKEKEGKWVLAVADQGIGITRNDAERIFDKFFRVGSEDTRQTKGTGLGLYIVKHLMHLHNGEIHLSRNQPKGSVFALVFPV